MLLITDVYGLAMLLRVQGLRFGIPLYCPCYLEPYIPPCLGGGGGGT